MQSVGTFQTIGKQKIKTEGTVKSVQQTEQSKAAARPARPKLTTSTNRKGQVLMVAGTILGCIVGITANVLGFPSGTSIGTGFIIAVGIGAVAVAFIMAPPAEEEVSEHRRMFKDLYRAHDEWERTFACVSCGYRFVPVNA